MARASGIGRGEALAAEKPFRTFRLFQPHQGGRSWRQMLQVETRSQIGGPPEIAPRQACRGIGAASQRTQEAIKGPSLPVRSQFKASGLPTRPLLPPVCPLRASTPPGRDVLKEIKGFSRTEKSPAGAFDHSAFLTLSIYRSGVTIPDVSPRSEAQGPNPVGTIASPLGSSKGKWDLPAGGGEAGPNGEEQSERVGLDTLNQINRRKAGGKNESV